jgi:uncharacterized membrane protein HdeD (DUF308 family)
LIHLDIDNIEKQDLREFLQHCVNWLTVEIHHTDTRSFRERLKQKEKVIQNVLAQLESGANRQSEGRPPASGNSSSSSDPQKNKASQPIRQTGGRNDMKRNRAVLSGRVLSAIVLSLPMIVAGGRAIVLPLETGQGLAILVGWLLLLSGATHLAYAWHTLDSGGHRLTTTLLGSGVAFTAAGAYVLLHPQVGFPLLMYIILTCLAGDSIIQFILRYGLCTLSGSPWLCFEGIANTLILGIMLVGIWTMWPVTSTRVIGISVGLSMLFSGVARLMVSLSPRGEAGPIQEAFHEIE